MAIMIIIVGAGTAAALANRLTANLATRVLLIEAGGSDIYHWVQIPVGWPHRIGNLRTDWMMKTGVRAGLERRSPTHPRGKVLGGCSSVNGSDLRHGQAADYDGWRQMAMSAGRDDVSLFHEVRGPLYGRAPALHGGRRMEAALGRRLWPILNAVQEGVKEFGVMPRRFQRWQQRGSALRGQKASNT